MEVEKIKKCWVVEQGTQDDYRVLGVFTSRQNAEMAVAALAEGEWNGPPWISEWVLDPGVAERAEGLFRYAVCFPGHDGQEVMVYPSPQIDRDGRGRLSWHSTHQSYYIVWAKTPEEAVSKGYARHKEWLGEKR